MVEIIATPEQAAALAAATPRDAILLRNAEGKLLASLLPTHVNSDWSDEEIAEIIRRRGEPGPTYTTAEVLAYCRSLAPE